MKLFAMIASAIGSLVALTASGACWWGFFEEIEMPKSLVK